jgi:GNAT superfamily N-acetyltransferase
MPVPLVSILAQREEYRREMRCQIVHDSWHARGFTDSYLLRRRGELVGYGSVAGDPYGPREVVKEFYLAPSVRGDALPLFRALIATSGARRIESQTNDTLLTLLLFDCAAELESTTILFADAGTTEHRIPGLLLRPLTDADQPRIFAHTREPVGQWGLELDGAIVATGGLLFHYNPPYGDIFMEVASGFRRRGVGSFLVQELKRLCYERGCTPVARCQQENVASRRTLARAGLLPCARIVSGRIVDTELPRTCSGR